MSGYVGEVSESLENRLIQNMCLILNINHGFTAWGAGPQGNVSEDPVTQEKRKKGCRMKCDVGEATEALENEQ